MIFMKLKQFQQGFTHAFSMEFASQEDYAYYSTEDPVHLGLGKDELLVASVVNLLTIDFPMYEF